MFLCALDFEPPNRTFLPKVSKKEPKGYQKPPKRMLSDLSKHIVFTIQNPLFAVSGELWEHTCCRLLSGYLFFVFLFLTFEICGAEKVSNMGKDFLINDSKLDPIAQKLP